jgi:hypothetical protein
MLDPMQPSYWFCALVSAASALTILGFSVAVVRGGDDRVLPNARYALSRSVALALTALLNLAALI